MLGTLLDVFDDEVAIVGLVLCSRGMARSCLDIGARDVVPSNVDDLLVD